MQNNLVTSTLSGKMDVLSGKIDSEVSQGSSALLSRIQQLALLRLQTKTLSGKIDSEVSQGSSPC